jgi:DNA-binding response OmpR family regulator
VRLLLVEDDASLAAGLSLALRNKGFAVNHVTRGDHALHAVATAPPDLIVLDLGADDYLAKPFEMQELEARLRALGRRLGNAGSSLIALGDLQLDTASMQVHKAGVPVELSRREYALLKALLENSGKVLTRETLEGKLYGWDEEVASNTLEVHIHHLRRKLGQDLIRTVRGVGYCLRQP